MSYAILSVTAPTLSAYDPDNPTQATEELNLQLHNILQDMEDNGFYVNDGRLSTTLMNFHQASIRNCVKVVFDYAASAIEDFRAEDPIGLAEPSTTEFANFTYAEYYPFLSNFQNKVFLECYKMMYLIYYMWKTETDPLRIKDYIRDMLLAWPLQDISIDLKDEGGSQLRVYPTWSELET